MTPRFEFRVFADHLTAERDLLDGSAILAGEEEPRTDTYFVVADSVDASLKLRGGKLDLKLLRDRKEGLELWEPVAEAEFPVTSELLRSKLLGPARVRLHVPAAPVDRDLLLRLALAAPETRLVRVEKRRRRHSLDGVAAEFTRLAIDGRPVESVAVEEADLERALGAVAALGLLSRRNTSYQRFLVERLFATTGGAGS